MATQKNLVVQSISIHFSVFCPVNTLSRGYEIRFVVIVLNTFTYPRSKSKFMVKIECLTKNTKSFEALNLMNFNVKMFLVIKIIGLFVYKVR